MNDVITIENTEMQIREYKGQRVVTFKDIDAVHGNKAGTAKRNFTRNKKHFIENEDFIVATRNISKRDNLSLLNIDVPTRGITLLTESGYLLIAKSFTDDLSWKVQRQLVNAYFKVREVQKEPYYKEPLAEDFTPRVPIVSDWYERNKGRMYRLCRDSGNSRSYLYHCILNRLSERYDLNAAREIYKNEVGNYPEYPIDIVKYFPELEQDADKILDRIERITYRQKGKGANKSPSILKYSFQYVTIAATSDESLGQPIVNNFRIGNFQNLYQRYTDIVADSNERGKPHIFRFLVDDIIHSLV